MLLLRCLYVLSTELCDKLSLVPDFLKDTSLCRVPKINGTVNGKI